MVFMSLIAWAIPTGICCRGHQILFKLLVGTRSMAYNQKSFFSNFEWLNKSLHVKDLGKQLHFFIHMYTKFNHNA